MSDLKGSKMKKVMSSVLLTTSLAIFSMLFGAGNLMFPINVGLLAGDQNLSAIISFMITAILLPLIGIATIILFNGDYQAFFNRLGKYPGTFMALACLLTVGPLIAMPRIVTLSFTMIWPFIPSVSMELFSLIFLGATFLATVRENKIMDVLGNIISPILLVSLLIIIGKALVTGGQTASPHIPLMTLIWNNIKYGYQTLDVLAGIFFGSIVLTILKQNFAETNNKADQQELALLSLKAGTIGTTLLGLIYVGLSYLGAYFGNDIGVVNEGQLFSAISFKVLGSHGALVISTAVLMACFSTIIALAAVFAEYLHTVVFQRKIRYSVALLATLIATFIISYSGLDAILKHSAPFIEIGYPVLIVLMFCNLAYKLFGFKPVKLPVLATLVLSLFAYLR